MDVAKFLDQPIRFNPQRSRALSVSIPSSPSTPPSYEGTTSTPSLTSTSSSNSTPARISSPIANWKDPMLERSKQILATPDHPSTADDSGRKRATKDRRKIIKAACSACQRRKSKCDGERPACGACVSKEISCEYSTRVGMSIQAARREQLKSYATILGLVRDAAPEDCDRILQDLRGPQTLEEATETIQRNWILKSGD